MTSPSRFLLFLFLLLVTTRPCSAQVPELALKFPPPSSAVERNAKEWRELSSSTGGFAVLMPGKPEESVKSIDTARGTLTTHVFPLTTQVATYVVSVTNLPFVVTEPDRAQTMLDGSIKRVLGLDRNKLLSETRISLEGNPGRRFVIEVPHLKCVMNGKAYIVNDKLYTMIITTRKYQAAPRAIVDFYESIISKFLDSFRLLDGKLNMNERTEEIGLFDGSISSHYP